MSAFVPITLVRYERDRPFDPSATGFMTLSIAYKIPGDAEHRGRVALCFLTPVEGGQFVCDRGGGWIAEPPRGSESSIWVNDPAMSVPFGTVASRIWVNGQLVTRIQHERDGQERGLFTYPIFGDKLR